MNQKLLRHSNVVYLDFEKSFSKSLIDTSFTNELPKGFSEMASKYLFGKTFQVNINFIIDYRYLIRKQTKIAPEIKSHQISINRLCSSIELEINKSSAKMIFSPQGVLFRKTMK